MKLKLDRKLACLVLCAMMTGNVFAAPTEAPKQNPETITNQQQKVQPFVLDNFKVIEATLNHLGVNNDELASLIKEGKKLEDVLKEKKIPVRKFKKEVICEYYKAVDEGVAKKQLTEEQASKLKAAIKETVKDWLPKK